MLVLPYLSYLCNWFQPATLPPCLVLVSREARQRDHWCTVSGGGGGVLVIVRATQSLSAVEPAYTPLSWRFHRDRLGSEFFDRLVMCFPRFNNVCRTIHSCAFPSLRGRWTAMRARNRSLVFSNSTHHGWITTNRSVIGKLHVLAGIIALLQNSFTVRAISSALETDRWHGVSLLHSKPYVSQMHCSASCLRPQLPEV